MANRERGEMTLATQNKDVSYTLKLTTNACCDLEDRSGRLFYDVIRGSTLGSMRDVRWLLWAALQEFHADTVRDQKDAGRIIDACGGIEQVMVSVTNFLKLNEDDSPDVNAEGGGKNPPTAQAPTGDNSTSTPGPSV